MNGILKGVKPLDCVLAAVLSAGGALMAVENVLVGTGEAQLEIAHEVTSTSWWMLPAFLLMTVPILWRRRNILAVTAVTAAATAAHVLAFDWVTRCGVGLPLSFALAYAVGRFAGGRNHQILGVAGVVLVQFLVLVKDSSTGGLGPILATIPLGLLFWGAGRLVASRTTGPRAAERELATA